MANVNKKPIWRIMGDRCGECGQYFKIRADTTIDHMCPPGTRSIRQHVDEAYKLEYLARCLFRDEMKLMWGERRNYAVPVKPHPATI